MRRNEHLLFPGEEAEAQGGDMAWAGAKAGAGAVCLVAPGPLLFPGCSSAGSQARPRQDEHGLW